MKIKKQSIAIIFILIAIPITAWSQLLMADVDNQVKQAVFINMALEPEWVTTLGYSHAVMKNENGLALYLGGSIKFASTILPKGAWRFNIAPSLDWQFAETWKTQVTTNLYLAHDHSRAGTLDGLGFELRAPILHDGKKWTKGFDLGWQYTAFTHIQHAAETKDTFNDRYPEQVQGMSGPQDGWYGSTANRFRIGVTGARKLGDHLAWRLAFGSLIVLQKQGIVLAFPYAQFPVYLESGLQYSW